MAVTLYDATIEGSQLITAGTTIAVAADFLEVNSQSFTISSATATLFNSSGSAVSTALTDLSAIVSSGLRGSKRVSATLNASDTASVAAGYYYLIWSITLSDSQTRKVKQSIQVRTVS